MNLPLFAIMMVCFVLAVVLAIYLFKKKKVYYIPSAAMLGISFLLLGYTQVSIDQGGWNDLGYVILAFMIFFLSIITTLIVFIYRYFKYKKNDAKDS